MKVLGSVLRFLFAWIDSIAAKMITAVYNLLMELADLTLYSENIVKIVGQRIGLILGIFMLFRIAISLINYMISPDRFSDSKQGGGQLIKNIIVSLVLLATVNIIFETAYSVQKKIVSSGIIEKIFFGENSETKMDIGYYLYTGFFTPNTKVLPDCENMWEPTANLANTACDDELFELLETNARDSIHKARNNLDMSQIFSNYDVVMSNKGGAFKGDFLFEYTPIISTAVGVIALLIMISFSMDLAKRAIKLLFLQIIAPVPIIFNMDTGKGKDVFQKWYKECFNTYISVFIRLLSIDFAVFMIVLVKGNFADIFQGKLLLNTFIIIGCLMFAKEVPKLIEDMLGIKMDGMSLRPLKKFQEQALFGKNITGLAAGTVGGVIGGASGVVTGVATGRYGAAIGAGLLNPFKGAFSGLTGGKGLKDTWNNQKNANATMRTAILNGSTFGGRLHTHISNALGTGGTAGRLEVEKHRIQDQIDDIDQQIKAQEDLKAQIKGTQEYRNRQHAMQQQQAISSAAAKMKERAVSQVRNGEGNAGQTYNNMKQQAEALKHLDFSRRRPVTYQGNTYNSAADAAAAAEALLQQAEHFAENDGWRDYASQVSNGRHNDATFTSMQMKFDDAHQDVFGNVINHAATDYGDQLNGALGTSKGAITQLEVDGSQDERQIAAYDRVISDLSGQKQPLNDQMRDISRRESRVNADKNAVGGK